MGFNMQPKKKKHVRVNKLLERNVRTLLDKSYNGTISPNEETSLYNQYSMYEEACSKRANRTVEYVSIAASLFGTGLFWWIEKKGDALTSLGGTSVYKESLSNLLNFKKKKK